MATGKLLAELNDPCRGPMGQRSNGSPDNGGIRAGGVTATSSGSPVGGHWSPVTRFVGAGCLLNRFLRGREEIIALMNVRQWKLQREDYKIIMVYMMIDHLCRASIILE